MGLIKMKTYEELLSDIEDDMELMGASHIVYLMKENGLITDYDYLPSDSYTISMTLKDLQENLRQKILFDKAASHSADSDKTKPKLAVVFPGIGYTADKPLLYYTIRLAKHCGYQIQTVSYHSLPEKIKGDPRKIKQAFDIAFKQTEEYLQNVDWTSYGEILFISKSVGTVISSAYTAKHNLAVKNILFTPLAETFNFPQVGSIAFHGTADPWAETDSIRSLAAEKEVSLFLTENANHSLETGVVKTDLSILKTTMERVERFIKG